ncbi:hypothetical protein SLS60_010762 [Paraconiothyrium brasiliense]|uniref:Uncharacterized protein n=1 Tax=Paraconiothyrium brasiliense TaxID=300254 RepID=A0ABR3QLW9_9PLEO
MNQIGVRNEVMYGTCPCCRTKLFSAIGLDAPYINARTWAQTLYGLKGTEFEAIGRLARRRLDTEGDGSLTIDLVDDIVREMVEQNSKYKHVAVSLGVLERARPSLSHYVALQQYEVDVNTADHSVVNTTIHGDIATLRVSAAYHMWEPLSQLDRGETVNWAPIIDTILENWEMNNYPRCNYITLRSLHRLLICAFLVDMIGAPPGNSHSNTAGYAQLLAHGERLLLEAQQRVASGELSETHLREHYRVLDWTDSGDPGAMNIQDPHLYHPRRTHLLNLWIVELRRRTRGQGANSLTAS